MTETLPPHPVSTCAQPSRSTLLFAFAVILSQFSLVTLFLLALTRLIG